MAAQITFAPYDPAFSSIDFAISVQVLNPLEIFTVTNNCGIRCLLFNYLFLRSKSLAKIKIVTRLKLKLVAIQYMKINFQKIAVLDAMVQKSY